MKIVFPKNGGKYIQFEIGEKVKFCHIFKPDGSYGSDVTMYPNGSFNKDNFKHDIPVIFNFIKDQEEVEIIDVLEFDPKSKRHIGQTKSFMICEVETYPRYLIKINQEEYKDKVFKCSSVYLSSI